MTAFKPRPYIALLAVAVLASCGSDTTTAPAKATPLDLATVVSQLSRSGLNGVPGAASLASTPASFAPPFVVPAACSYSSSTQGFTCPPVVAGGVTFNISYFLYDAGGQPQSQAVGINASTARVRTVTDAAGTVTLPVSNGGGGSVAIADHSDNTLSGLLGPNLVLNGLSTSHYVVTTTGATAIHSALDASTATENVVFPARNVSSPSQYPLSGTVTSDLKSASTPSALPSLFGAIHVVITFNGTSTPTAAITLAGVTRTCKVDLTGQSEPVCS